jgi:hypothetical protein
MAIRRATKVVAGTTMPRSATPWLPRAWPEGPREVGIGQRRGCQSTPKYTWGASIPLRGRIFLSEDTAPPCAVSPDFTATLMGRGFASGLPCQAPSEGGQPFASSPFAHPIPQSRRRARGDLFSASLDKPFMSQGLSIAVSWVMITMASLEQRNRPARLGNATPIRETEQ